MVMTYEELLASMEIAAEQKNQNILSQATHQAEEILTEANERAVAIKAQFLTEKKLAYEAHRVRNLYRAREETKTVIDSVIHELYNQAFFVAGEELAGIRNLASYPELFKKLLIEAVQELEEEKPLFHIDSRDQALCRHTLEQLQIPGEIIADITCNGGLSVSSTDGRVITINTIESRLEMAKDLMKIEIYLQFTGG